MTLRPVRFTDNLDAMRAFLEEIGLRPRIESIRGGWVDMVAGSGMAALHGAASSASGGRPGETRLSYEAEDVDALAEHLKAGGYDDATVWDEAYGRVLSVTAPDGGRVWVDERSRDLYGYREHQAQADPRITVAPVVYSDEPDAWQRFASVIGGTGIIVRPAAQNPGIIAGPAAVQLGFRIAGQTGTGTGADEVLTDPDGQPVLIQRLTSSAVEG
jgi:hypothetical protein